MGGGGAGGGATRGSMAELTEVAVKAMKQGTPSGGGGGGTPGAAASATSGASSGSGAMTAGSSGQSGAPNRGDAGSPARTAGVVRADAFDPLPDGDMPDAVHGGRARGSSRGTNADAASAASTGSGTSPGEDPASRAPEGDRAISGASSNQRSARERKEPKPESLEVPPTSDASPALEAPAIESIAAASPLAPLLGFWQQIDDGRSDADFAPGGFTLGLLAIRPTQRSMQVYRAWGTPPEALVIAAELRATFQPNGTVRVEETPAQPSRFPSRAIELPARNGQPARTVVPPARPLPFDTSWAIEPDGRLRLDGRLYRPIDRAEFDRLGRAAASGAGLRETTSTAAAAGTSAASRDPAGGVDFFGARVRGRYICFVCDISGSMMGDKLEALKAEIIRTIRALPEGSQVQVTFFDDRPHVLVAGWTRTGTPACETLLRKIDGVGTGGGTDAVDALQYTLAQLDPLPHELFLLTDGRFARDPSQAIVQLNSGKDRTRIHTLAMGDDADRDLLEAIAKAHGGTFTHVPAAAPTLPVP
jgi:Mg-chelatase subunit ChlD